MLVSGPIFGVLAAIPVSKCVRLRKFMNLGKGKCFHSISQLLYILVSVGISGISRHVPLKQMKTKPWFLEKADVFFFGLSVVRCLTTGENQSSMVQFKTILNCSIKNGSLYSMSIHF